MAEKHDCNSGEETFSLKKPPRDRIFYLSCDLRLLAEVAAHVKRCRKCYVVEKESEGLAGGWRIRTPNGSSRSSIVAHPLYEDLTSNNWHYCMNCFRQCFDARVPCSEDGQNYLQVLEEKGEAIMERSKLANVGKERLSDLELFDDMHEVVIVEEETKKKGKEAEIDALGSMAENGSAGK